MTKVRLDQTLVDDAMAESKSKAQALIEAGYVLVNGAVVSKSSKSVRESDKIEVTGQEHPWVSRGGMKLAHATSHFKILAKDKTAIDVGASTGGFTDVLLQSGAAKVYAVDVGTDQLHPKIRGDERVVSLEQINARDLDADLIPDMVDLVVCDASFISLKKVLSEALKLTKPCAELITLIKPQFEVGKEAIGKSGVVKDEALQKEVCANICKWMGELDGWTVQGVTDSPITGPKGNKEFLLYARKGV